VSASTPVTRAQDSLNSRCTLIYVENFAMWVHRRKIYSYMMNASQKIHPSWIMGFGEYESHKSGFHVQNSCWCVSLCSHFQHFLLCNGKGLKHPPQDPPARIDRFLCSRHHKWKPCRLYEWVLTKQYLFITRIPILQRPTQTIFGQTNFARGMDCII